MNPSARARPIDVRLRPTVRADVPELFRIQLDPLANELAGTRPRDWPAFEARWNEILGEPGGTGDAGVTPRVILADGELAGSINVFPQEGTDSIGYWLERGQWGRGIASRAVALLIAEVAIRPLHARVVAHNPASRRVLERNGFVVVSCDAREATDRYAAAEVFTLRLG